MTARREIIRRIIFYVLVLGYIIVHVATRKHDWIWYAIFAAMSIYAVAQLVEDLTTLRRSNRDL